MVQIKVQHAKYLFTENCPGVILPESILKDKMLNLFREHEPYLADILTSSVGDMPEKDHLNKELNSSQSEFDRNRRYLEGLYESLVCGDISDDEYKEMKSAYEVKVMSLSERIKLLRDEIHVCTAQKTVLSEAHANMKRLRDNSSA